MEVGALLTEGFALGVATGPYCLFSCAPVIFPFLLAGSAGTWTKNAGLLAEFILGRLTAYILFGAACGFAGSRFSGTVPSAVLNGAVLLSGILLLFIFFFKSMPHLSWCAAAGRSALVQRIPFLFGFLVGINLCPPFITGMVRVFQMGSVLGGAVYFFSFFFGTTLYLLPAGMVLPFGGSKRLQNIGALACALVGVWFTVLGLYGFFKK